MKKVFIVLMALVVVAGIAFAADPTPTTINNTTANTITLKSEIKEVIPAFKLYYGATEADAELPTAEVATGKSIADDEKITATFWIKQEGEADNKEYSRYGAKNGGTAVKLTVSCGAFVYYGATGAVADKDLSLVSGAPAISGQAFVGTSTNGLLTFAAADISTADVAAVANTSPAGKSVTFSPKYYGKKVTDRTIATFTAEWAAKDDLPIGVYKADITLSYTTN